MIEDVSKIDDATEHPKIGIFGLGIMGGAIAKNLVDDGYQVFGYDPDAVQCQNAQNAGIKIIGSVKEVAENSHIMFSSLPNADALDTNVSELITLSESERSAGILIELSTLDLATKQKNQARLVDAGFDLLDCPISGTGQQAKTRDIVLFASGNQSVFSNCSSIFKSFAKNSYYLGDFGNGTKMKLIANLLVAIHNVATAEAVTLAKRSGLNMEQFYEVISSSPCSSKIFELRAPLMIDNNYEPATMKLDVWQKDMQLIREFANNAKSPIPLFTTTEPLYQAAIDADLGQQDTAAVCNLLNAN
jgi:3-hydroxyisobutyrate dehydrogenase-like beta-hydroxyacid dehydrogenase|tara:strand:+ start:987 stop:1895 length:909 start_codon:yes stop_codon:yes gene_type:complete